MRQEITCVTMDLTTHCDRRCPDCCAGIGINRVLQHHPWESDTVAYADGMFFPCCVSPGLDGTRGVPPGPDWRTEVLKMDMGCNVCMFSPKEEA